MTDTELREIDARCGLHLGWKWMQNKDGKQFIAPVGVPGWTASVSTVAVECDGAGDRYSDWDKGGWIERNGRTIRDRLPHYASVAADAVELLDEMKKRGWLWFIEPATAGDLIFCKCNGNVVTACTFAEAVATAFVTACDQVKANG